MTLNIKLEPGPAIDALVCKAWGLSDHGISNHHPQDCHSFVHPPYSICVTDAVFLLDELDLSCWEIYSDGLVGYRAQIGLEKKNSAEASTLPHAVCLALLKTAHNLGRFNMETLKVLKKPETKKEKEAKANALLKSIFGVDMPEKKQPENLEDVATEMMDGINIETQPYQCSNCPALFMAHKGHIGNLCPSCAQGSIEGWDQPTKTLIGKLVSKLSYEDKKLISEIYKQIPKAENPAKAAEPINLAGYSTEPKAMNEELEAPVPEKCQLAAQAANTSVHALYDAFMAELSAAKQKHDTLMENFTKKTVECTGLKEEIDRLKKHIKDLESRRNIIL